METRHLENEQLTWVTFILLVVMFAKKLFYNKKDGTKG